jgi:hypothetical protein
MSGWISYCPSSRAMTFVAGVRPSVSNHYIKILLFAAGCGITWYFYISLFNHVFRLHSKFTSHILMLKRFAFTRQAISQRPQTCMSTFGLGCPHHGQAVFCSKERWFSLIFGRTRVQLWYGAVGIATGHRLEVRGSNPGGERYSAPVQTGPGAQSTSYTMGTGSFPGVNRPGRGVDYLPTYGAKIKGLCGLFQGQI